MGDNLEETLRDFRDKLRVSALQDVDNSRKQVHHIFFEPLEKQFRDVKNNISIFYRELEELQQKYKQKRS